VDLRARHGASCTSAFMRSIRWPVRGRTHRWRGGTATDRGTAHRSRTGQGSALRARRQERYHERPALGTARPTGARGRNGAG
jgi:hypothetical protein